MKSIDNNNESSETGATKMVGLNGIVIGKGAGVGIPMDKSKLTKRSSVMVGIDKLLTFTFFNFTPAYSFLD